MPTTQTNATEEVLDYIQSLPQFAKVICTQLRTIILNAVPGIIEDWKWGPNYNWLGMVCGFSGFQKHVKITFFNGSAMSDSKKLFNHCVDNQFSRSIKFTDVSEIDEKALTEYVKESAKLNEGGFKREIKNKNVEVPADLEKALSKNKAATKYFEGLTYGYRKEYVEWITSAKREETRSDRITKTVSMCSEGRTLNDKYKK